MTTRPGVANERAADSRSLAAVTVWRRSITHAADGVRQVGFTGGLCLDSGNAHVVARTTADRARCVR